MNVRPTNLTDLAPLTAVVARTGLFPSNFLVALASDFLSEASCEEIWLTCDVGGRPVGFCFAVPEKFADGVWNMRAIAVTPEDQGKGCGAALLEALEAMVSQRGGRMIVIDTSNAAEQRPARKLYAKIGYSEAARIPDFWAEGDDKLVFWKRVRTKLESHARNPGDVDGRGD